MMQYKRNKSLCNQVLFSLFLFVIATIPWLHGGELPWEIFLFSALTTSFLSVYLLTNKTNFLQELAPIKLPIYCLLAWFVYNCLFLIYLPIDLAMRLSPNLEIANSDAASYTRLVTVSKSLSLLELARVTCVVSAFLLCYLLAKEKSRQITILKVIFYSAAVMALYSQLNHYTNGQYELVRAIPPFNSSWESAMSGTFSYKNQYAIYSAMCIFIGLGLLITDLQKQNRKNTIWSLSSFMRNILFEKHIVTIFITLCALKKSHARKSIS